MGPGPRRARPLSSRLAALCPAAGRARRARRRPVAGDPRVRPHRPPQRLALLPGRRPDLVHDERLAPRRRLLPPTFVGFGWSLLLVPLSWLVGPDYVGFLPAIIALKCSCSCRSRSPASTRSRSGSAAGFSASVRRRSGSRRRSSRFRSSATDYHERYVEQFLPAGARADGAGRLPVDGLPARRGLAARARLDAARLDVGRAGGHGGRRCRDDQAVESPLPRRAGARARRSPAAGARSSRTPPRRPVARAPRALEATRARHGAGFALEETRVAAGALVSASVLDRYIFLDWDTFRHNMASLREYAAAPACSVDSVRGHVRAWPVGRCRSAACSPAGSELPAREGNVRRWRRSTAAASSGS